MTASVPKELGPFTIESELGRGGMGIVYLATQRGLNRLVALKVMDPRLLRDPDFARRFNQEAATLAQVDSPHVIAIYDHGRVGDVLYLATQYVAGGDLSMLLERQGALPAEQALELFSQILKGLRDAHRAGVIHRDIKPANILVRADQSEPHVYLCDFGIAQATEADHLTGAGMVAGSAAFMAPERNAGLPASVQSDLYSAACVLWVMLSGRNLHAGTDFQVATQHATGPIPQVTGADSVSQAINLVFRSCLAKDPEQRPRSAEEALRLLASVQSAPLEAPAPATRLRPAPSPASLGSVVDDTLLRNSPATGGSAVPPRQSARSAAPEQRRRAGLVLGIIGGALALVLLGAFGLSNLSGGQRTAAAPWTAAANPSHEAGPSRSEAPDITDSDFICWDGTGGSNLQDCGTPSGKVGLVYVFPSLADDRDSCELDSPLIEHRPGTTSYRCEYPGGIIVYRYWADGQDAQRHFEKSYAGEPARSDLVLDGQIVGYQYRGALGNGEFSATAALLNSHFTVSAASPESRGWRNELFGSIRFRAVADLNGHPSTDEPGVAAST